MLFGAAVWVALDALHAGAINIGHRLWERQIAWTPAGIREGCEAARYGEGDTMLILVHGFADTPAVYRHLAPALARRGVACRTVRLPGHAVPLGTARRASSLEAWRETLRQVVLEAREEATQVWLVGHSMGGALALNLVRREPSLCDGLVLLAPLFAVSPQRSLGIPGEPLFRLADALTFFTGAVYNLLPLDLHDPLEATAYPRTRFVPLSQYRALFEVLEENRALPPELHIPTLLVLAEQDRIVQNQPAAAFVRHSGAPRFEIQRLPGAGHVLPWERTRPPLADMLIQFLPPPAASAEALPL